MMRESGLKRVNTLSKDNLKIIITHAGQPPTKMISNATAAALSSHTAAYKSQHDNQQTTTDLAHESIS
jgi:hypothetical protein